MDIILIKDVANLGLAGEVLKVAPGYARNYLFPSGLALSASASTLKALARKRAEFETRAKEAKDLALELKAKFSSLYLVLYRKSGDKGKLYGAVTPSDIVSEAEAEGFTIDRKKLRLAEPIKTVGDFEVTVKLHPEVTASFKIKVLPESAKFPDDPVEEALPQDASTDKADNEPAASNASETD